MAHDTARETGDAIPSAETGDSFELRALSTEDIPAICALRATIFPDSLLSHLGGGIVENLYRGYLTRPECWAFLALADGNPVGFITGMLDRQRFFRAFYRRHFVKLAWHMLLGVAGNPQVRRHFKRKLRQLWPALRSLPPSPARGDAEVAERGKTPAQEACLLAVGVLPGWQGRGIGASLVSRLLRTFRDSGCELARLAARVDNQRALAFYEHTGWARERTTRDEVHFVRRIDNLPSPS